MIAVFSSSSSSVIVVVLSLISMVAVLLTFNFSKPDSVNSSSPSTFKWDVGNSSFGYSAASLHSATDSLILYNKSSSVSPAPKIKLGGGGGGGGGGSSSLDNLEARLAEARASIKRALILGNNSSSIYHQDPDFVPRSQVYWHPNAFHRSYLEMEKLLKIYIYEEGEPPLFHDGPSRNIYSTEGRFIHEMEKGKLFRTTDPNRAVVFFLPFSVAKMVTYLLHNRNRMQRVVIDYMNLIAHAHPFWNRSRGADHFMLSCHDWGPLTTSFVPYLFHNSIRVLCNANTSERFKPFKDASFPEINIHRRAFTIHGGRSPSARSILAFFAGQLHGHIRYLLLKQWKNKDQDVQVYGELPAGMSYEEMMKSSKFCLCPSGYEVASPRVVEAIFAECVPVLINDGYIPPFSDVLNWKLFSVEIKVKDIPNIKDILMGISTRRYLELQRRVKEVQRHFVVNGTPKRYDVFHMTLHSIWLRRLNVRIQDHGTQSSTPMS